MAENLCEVSTVTNIYLSILMGTHVSIIIHNHSHTVIYDFE